MSLFELLKELETINYELALAADPDYIERKASEIFRPFDFSELENAIKSL